MQKSRRLSAVDLAVLAVLVALQIILSRFLSFSVWNMKLGFAFVAVAIAAIRYGAIGGAAVYGLGDLIGAVCFPIGPYYPPFTLSAILSGAIWGLFLYRSLEWRRIFPAVIISELICSLGLNTLFVAQLYGSPFLLVLPTRILQVLVMASVECLLLGILARSKQLKQLINLGK